MTATSASNRWLASAAWRSFLNTANWLAQQEDLIAFVTQSRRLAGELTQDQQTRIFWITLPSSRSRSCERVEGTGNGGKSAEGKRQKAKKSEGRRKKDARRTLVTGARSRGAGLGAYIHFVESKREPAGADTKRERVFTTDSATFEEGK
jgi:hypothetical protein